MTRLAVIALFVLALSAGVVGGMLVARLPARSGAAAGTSSADEAAAHSPLVDELQLTPLQRQQMRTIWQGVQVKIVDCYTRYDDLQRQRDQDILKILNPSQQANFQAIAQDYKSRSDALVRQRQEAFAKAVEQTRQILNPAQQEKYEQIIKDRLGPDGLPRATGVGMGAATWPAEGPASPAPLP